MKYKKGKIIFISKTVRGGKTQQLLLGKVVSQEEVVVTVEVVKVFSGDRYSTGEKSTFHLGDISNPQEELKYLKNDLVKAKSKVISVNSLISVLENLKI